MVVRSEDVGFLPDVNNLHESAGAIAALSAKANFQRVPHFFADPIHLRRMLIAKREAARADTPLGHTCSNMVELLKARHNAEPGSFEMQHIPRLIDVQMARLEAQGG